MKMVILQLTNSMLKLTPVNKMSGRCIYGPPTSFALPSVLQKGESLNKLPELASFSRDCMCTCGFLERKSNLQIPKLIFCFDDDRLVSKEYQHMPTKKANLPQIAKLEAESVLQSSANDYIIQNYEYNRMDERTGKLKSVLYAAPARIVRDIKREYKRNSMNVIRIVPTINGLINATKTAMNLGPYNRDYKNRTFAVVDVGFEKIRLALFSNNVPLFEKTFEAIYPDILYTISKERRVSAEDAEKLIYHQGISNCIVDSVTSEASKQRINTLFETTFGEIIRTIRVVLSSERLELESIVFCGTFASQPNFESYLSSLGLETPFANIERVASQANMHIALNKQALQYGCHPADFFSINGIVMASREASVDFVKTLEQKNSNLVASAAVMIVCTVVAAAIMLVPLWNIHNAQAQIDQDNIALTNPDYVEPKQLQQKEADLQQKIKEVDKNKTIVPYRKSNAEEPLQKVLTNINPKIVELKNYKFDAMTGTVQLSFSMKTYGDYTDLRKTIMDNKYFCVLVPFTVAYDEQSKIYICDVTLYVKNFVFNPTTPSAATPAVPAASAAPAANTSSSTSSAPSTASTSSAVSSNGGSSK